jgi:transposase-like protein
MAHDIDKRRQARKAYVHERQTLPMVALTLHISESTLRRWKQDSRKSGDNWDRARTANLIAGEGVEAMGAQVLEEFVIQHQAAIAALKADEDMPAILRAKTLASLADSFIKTVNASKKAHPKISELAVAMQVLTDFSEFINVEFPQHAEMFLQVLEPFGERLAEKYG